MMRLPCVREMRFLFVCTAVLSVLFIGAGCSTVRVETGDTPAVPPAFGDVPVRAEPELVRESLEGGVEHIAYSFSTTSQARLELYGFPEDAYRMRLAVATEGKLMGTWREDASAQIVAGINAMYFLEDLSPAGFFVADGVESRAHPFDWDVSALFVVDEEGKLTIRPTTEEPEDLATLTQAAQSYPLLVLNGEPLLKEDSGKLSRRSFVGTDTSGRVWIGVLVDGEASLYRLGQILMDVGIPWEHVLNLDGGSSSGMFVRGVGDDAFFPSFVRVPSALLIERRAE